MPEPRPSERSIFESAIDIAAPAERAAYLERACGGDTALRHEVEALLEAHQRLAGLASTLGGPAETAAGERPTAAIGPYRLLRRLGQGGMGTVYLAEQTEPVQRQVALKVIRPGLDGEQVVARFEAERQALALMDHPNIARVLDAGATAEGQPYFVMELVEGLPLTRYCDEQRLTLRQRLELFVDVCRAVQHAHTKGIIHRDLKPSNVLVALYDGRPLVKVIDFGVAKATGQRLTDKSLATQLGAVVGTLEYMAPEQAEPNNPDIDTRSDVYSLGVLLYELLTGTTPLRTERVREAGILELVRLIREEEPPPPSARLSRTEQLPAIAASRGLEPKKLSGAVRGELDWIVMKALEKDRDRRYESANGFAADVRRYLADEPVLACPPSVGYQLRKFGRRNRGVLSASALVVLALVAGAAVSAWQAVRATQAWNGERETHKKLDDARDEKEQQRARTDRDLNEALIQAAGELEKARVARPGDAGPWTRLRETLGRAKTLAESDLADPVLVGRVQALLAESSQDEVNRRMAERLEEIYFHVQTTSEHGSDGSRAAIGTVRGASRPDYEAAFRDYGLPVFDMDVDEAARRIAASPIRDSLIAALDDCANIREPWALRLLLIARRADDDPWRQQYFDARIQADGNALARLARRPEALNQPSPTICMLAVAEWVPDMSATLQLLRNAQARHPGDARINHALAAGLLGRGTDPEEKQRSLEESIGFSRAAVAARPESLALRRQLAFSLESFAKVIGDKPGPGAAAAAMSYYCEAIALDPSRAAAWRKRGEAYQIQGQSDKALADFSTAIEQDPNDTWARQCRGDLYRQLGRRDDALADYSKAIEAAPQHYHLMALLGRAGVYCEMEQWDRAVEDYSRVLKQSPQFTSGFYNRGLAYEKLRVWDKAVEDYSQVVKLQPQSADGFYRRGLAYQKLGMWDKAVADYEKAVEVAATNPGLRNDLARLLATCPESKIRNAERAVELAAKAVDQAPEVGRFWTTLGIAHYRNGDWQAAVAALDRSVDRNMDWGDPAAARLFLAMARQKLDDPDEARKQYDLAVQWLENNRQALEKNPGRAEELRRFRDEAEEVLGLKNK
jgi:serine/threonine protein kinase/tetratricopeptide (TPR) repeat protein